MKHIGLLILVTAALQLSAQKRMVALAGMPTDKDGRITDLYFVDDNTGWYYQGDRIGKTTDAGKSWIHRKTVGGGRSIEFMDKDTGVAGSIGGYISRTTDGGDTWLTNFDTAFINTGFCGLSHIGKKFYGCGAYYGSPKFFYSEDGGKTWQINRLDSLAAGLVDCHFFDEQNGLLTGTGKDFNSRILILRTSDGGKSWKVAHSSLANTVNYVWKLFQVNDSMVVASIQAKINGTIHFLKSFDRGNTWTRINTNVYWDYVQAICFENEQEGWFGGWEDGSYYTSDGGTTWRYTPYGQNLNRFFRLPSGRLLVSGRTIYELENTAVSINEVNETTKAHKLLSVNPNPAVNILNVEYEIDYSTGTAIHLWDATGKLLEKRDRKVEEQGKHTHVFDVAKYPNGIYHVVLLTDDSHYSKQVVVKR